MKYFSVGILLLGLAYLGQANEPIHVQRPDCTLPNYLLLLENRERKLKNDN
jgi:hypothetical protein